MKQREKLSLEEALVFVERTMKDEVKADLPPIQPMVAELLMRTGRDIPAHGMETEAALFYVLVMTLVAFDKANALILTVTQPAARAFFEKRLFGKEKDSPTGKDIAARCGKRLIPADSITDERTAADALNDYNAIPVLDADAFRRINRFPATVPGWYEKLSWWQKKFGSQAPPLTPVGEGLTKLNCVVRIAGEAVSADHGVGLLPIVVWGKDHELPDLV